MGQDFKQQIENEEIKRSANLKVETDINLAAVRGEQVAIKDLGESVRVGENLEEKILSLLASKFNWNVTRLGQYSDMDSLIQPKDRDPFFLEIKVRSKFYKEAICPIRKWQTACFIKERLKLNSFACFYFQDRPDWAFFYDLTMPVRCGQVLRKDRQKEDEYAYYLLWKRVWLKI